MIILVNFHRHSSIMPVSRAIDHLPLTKTIANLTVYY